MIEYYVQRILDRESLNKIKSLQMKAEEFVGHYPRHSQWFDMVTEEIVDGRRVAFGLFVSGLDDSGRPTVKVAGSAILKEKIYTPVMELKNLFVEAGSRGNGCGERLIEEVEGHCKRTGKTIVQTEVPAIQLDTVNKLHCYGFRVKRTIYSRFKKGDAIYLMEKTLTYNYTKDPFDNVSIYDWVLSDIFGFQLGKLSDDEQHRNFTYTPNEQSVMRTGNVGELSGRAYYLDNLERDDVNRLEFDGASIALAFTEENVTQKVSKIAHNLRVHLLNKNSLVNEYKSCFSFPHLAFKRDKIAGMIVVMKPWVLNRIHEQKSNPFVYFKGGPVGKYLSHGDKVFFFREPTPSDPVGGIVGYANLVEIKLGRPGKVWDDFSKEVSLFSKKDYRAFSKHKSSIIGLKCENFVHFSSEIDLASSSASTLKEIRKGVIGHLYVDDQVCGQILQMAKLLDAQDRPQTPML